MTTKKHPPVEQLQRAEAQLQQAEQRVEAQREQVAESQREQVVEARVAEAREQVEQELHAQTTSGYVERQWAGLPRYQCAFCPADFVSLAAIEEHLDANHANERV